MNEGCFSGGGKSERASERGGSELASCMGMTFSGFNGSSATKDVESEYVRAKHVLRGLVPSISSLGPAVIYPKRHAWLFVRGRRKET